MIHPDKLVKLWEACPELRPPGLIRESYGWDLERHAPVHRIGLIEDEHAEALIRDRMVWWLAHKDLGPQISSAATFHPDDGSPPVDTLWCVELFGINDEGDEEFLNADPTEALYLAVCKVLGREP